MNEALFNLVEHTKRNIFLTGKAGTGKTTFLNNFVKRTRKQYIVVAPTGIAAINAGGVTIHSMFGLPLRTFLPTTERIDSSLGNNIADLMPHFKYRKEKLKLLREVEIIIVDEVSMLRADVLDMMDFALRFIRRNQQKFGGVQMLFIGDLYQLPPVVRDEEVLKMYYKSPFFFDSLALKELPIVTVELTKVHRQKDEVFLNTLNAIRDGKREEIDFELLNSRYKPNFEPNDEPYVSLTSHNKMAEEINQKKLKELEGKLFFYKAKVIGDFKATQYPNDDTLELKVGAQVMFIRNDASGDKKYYNGKLAEVIRLSDDEIWVRIDGHNEDFKLKKEIWEQKKYSLRADKTIEEEVLGSFEQYPIRLAWAVTIHKSQGLTFDRLIIDAGKSFASGQVYVALSRCRTLEGIVLKSKITPEVIFSDSRVGKFQNETNVNERIEEILEVEKYDYAIEKILRYVDCKWFGKAMEEWYRLATDSKIISQEKVRILHTILKKETNHLNDIFDKFDRILKQKVQNFIYGKEQWQEVETKSKGAVNFFFKNINEKIFIPIKDFYAEHKGVKGLKQHNEELKILIDDIGDYLNDLKRLHLIDTPLFDDKNDEIISMKTAKIPTHIITYRLFEEGKNISEIAKERGVLATTILGHLSKFAETGILTQNDMERILTEDKIRIFGEQYHKERKENLNEWKAILPKDFEYSEIRLLWTFFDSKNKINEK